MYGLPGYGRSTALDYALADESNYNFVEIDAHVYNNEKKILQRIVDAMI